MSPSTRLWKSGGTSQTLAHGLLACLPSLTLLGAPNVASAGEYFEFAAAVADEMADEGASILVFDRRVFTTSMEAESQSATSEWVLSRDFDDEAFARLALSLLEKQRRLPSDMEAIISSRLSALYD
ncbi:MAG: hypothetical protein BroJett031_28010 [Betaproteobacteria bacterium]|nr:MAG: hypothetical protein BroJett031_28010 [Betaproteobacteria bacterium]